MPSRTAHGFVMGDSGKILRLREMALVLIAASCREHSHPPVMVKMTVKLTGPTKKPSIHAGL